MRLNYVLGNASLRRDRFMLTIFGIIPILAIFLLPKAFGGYTNESASVFHSKIRKLEIECEQPVSGNSSQEAVVYKQMKVEILNCMRQQLAENQTRGEIAYEAAKHEAMSDVAKGKLQLLSSGCWVGPEAIIYLDLLRAKLEVEVVDVKTWDPQSQASVSGREQGYNEVMRAYLRGKHGVDIFDVIRREARAKYLEGPNVRVEPWFPIQLQLLLVLMLGSLSFLIARRSHLRIRPNQSALMA